ncbi:MAG: hypothetical protein RL653_315 [Pseudomonadota bacterium]
MSTGRPPGEEFRLLGFLLVVALAGGLLWQFGGKLLGAAGGPELELLSALKDTEREGLSVPLSPGGPPVVSVRHHYDRVTVQVDAPARRAEAVATLDFEGRWGTARVGSLGLERVPFQFVDGHWAPAAGLAPRLSAILGALEARRQALERGDRAALAELSGGHVTGSPELEALLALRGLRLEVKAWLLRSEREEVLVTEEVRVHGTLPDRPVDELQTRRLYLTPRGDGFLFLRGLM